MNIENTKMPYLEIEKNKISNLFKWKSNQLQLPRNMELIIRLNGSIGYDFIHEKWVKGFFTGEVDDLNRFTKYVCKTLATTPETYELNREDVIVCGNNPLYSSDLPIIKFISEMRKETDVSIYYQLINSRNIPILSADTDKVKREIEIAFDKMKAGRPVVITTSLLEDITPLDITEKNAIEKMQYLSSFYEVLEKRNATYFGMDIPLVDKKAQVNSDELNNFGDITTLNFISAYESRLEFCDKMKEYGYEIECIKNPVYFDEPTKTDISRGTFETEEIKDESND